MERALDPDYGVTPDQITDMMEMYISLMHFRKVLPEIWAEKLGVCTRGIGLAMQIAAEGRLSRTPGLDPAVAKTIEDAMSLSGKEIVTLRKELMTFLAQLKQCPPSGAILH